MPVNPARSGPQPGLPAFLLTWTGAVSSRYAQPEGVKSWACVVAGNHTRSIPLRHEKDEQCRAGSAETGSPVQQCFERG
jgi:hypothetical protein